MTDVAPELLEKILTSFTNKLNQDKIIANVYWKLSEGTATHKDSAEFAARAGELLAETLRRNISVTDLPDGRMYYNIAQRVLEPLFSHNYELAADVAAQVQQLMNAAAGLGIKAIKPKLDTERVENIINKVSSAENFEDVAWMLDEPVVNFTQTAVDDTIRENVEFQAQSGLSPKVTRTVVGGCCEWCANLAGVYDYPVPREIYRRHNYCRCLVLYDPGDGRKQDAHSKTWYDSEKEARVARYEQIEAQKAKEAEAKSIMRDRVKSGKYSLKLPQQKYDEHVQGTPQYINTTKTRGQEPSRLLISKADAQELINLYSGTGTPKISRRGNISDVEFVTADHVIGQYFDGEKWVDTKRFGIYHGSKGSHIVPVKPGAKK